jgi:hypothetical protein
VSCRPGWAARTCTAATRASLLRKDPAYYGPLFGEEPEDLPYVRPPSDRPPSCLHRHTPAMRFTSTVILGGKTATGIEVPADVVDKLDRGKRPPVRVTLGGYTYRTTVAPMSGSFWIPLAAEHRERAGVAAGEQVEVDIEPDGEPRSVDVPDDLAAALDAAPGARAAFAAPSYTNQTRHALSVTDAKTEATRARRIAKVVDELGTTSRPG